MKKFFFSILAVGAMVACTKSEVNYNDASEISFAPVASTATKAVYGAVDGTTYPTGESFYVWGYWQGDVPAGSDNSAFTAPSKYIQGKAFKYASGNIWKGKDKSYYWPKTGSMIFACLSPVGAPVQGFNVDQHSLAGNAFNFAYVNPSETDKTVDLLWANNTLSYSEPAAGTGVPVKFNHALSWITFRVKGESVTQDGKFVVNSLILNDVNTYGSFNSAGNGAWTSQGTPADYEVFNGNQNLTGGLVDLEDTPKGTLVIPQTKATDYTATLVYTNKLGDTDIVETIDVKLGTGWSIGVHYIYNITFTPTEILIAPEVVDWIDVETPITY